MAESNTVSGGDDILASQYNNLRKDVLDTTLGHTHDGTDSKFIDNKMYSTRAYKNGSDQIDIPYSTPTLVTLETENWDLQNEFTSNRYTALSTGYYQVNASIHFLQDGALNNCAILVYKNGVSILSSQIRAIDGNLNVSDIVYLVATDYLELYFNFFGIGVSVATIYQSSPLTFISIIKIKSIE